MVLEHNTYKEAISDVKLSDERGMEMIENTIERKERWSQKWKAQMAAIAAGIVVIILSVNGICFAATGINAWDLLQSLYRENGENAEVMSQMFRESGETLTDGNLQFTLERYWYDLENGMAYFTIRMDSLDGSRLDDSEDAYIVNPHFNAYGYMAVGHGKPVVSEDGASITRHYCMMIAYTDAGGDSSLNAEEGISADAQKYAIEVKDGGTNENGLPTYKTAGYFILEPTGTMESLQLDSSALEHCGKITITGGGMRMYFDTQFSEGIEDGQEYEKEYPFGMVEIKMKDGTVANVVENLPEGNWEPIVDDDGVTIIGFKSDTMEISGDQYLGNFSNGGGGDGEDGWDSQYLSRFTRFINIDDVESVSVDGVELPIINR